MTYLPLTTVFNVGQATAITEWCQANISEPGVLWIMYVAIAVCDGAASTIHQHKACIAFTNPDDAVMFRMVFAV